MTLFVEFREGLVIAWNALLANKLRSGLTTLGIVIGIVTVTLMGAAINGLNASFRQSISQLGSDVLYVQKFPWGPDDDWWSMRNRRDIRLEDSKILIRQATHALAVSVEAGAQMNVSYKTRTARAVTVMGNNEESAFVWGLPLQEGRFLSAADVLGSRPVCVVGSELAGNLFPYESPVGKKVTVDGVPFEVVGVIGKRGKFLFGSMDNQIIVPITKFITEIARRPDVFFVVKVKDVAKLEDAKEELQGIMRKIRKVPPGKPDDFAINQQDIIIKVFNRVGGAIATIGLFVTSLSLFVGGIGIMNIMFVSVAERTKEIGIRKAIGAKRRTILIQFLVEAVAICLFAGLIGLVVAFVVTQVAGKLAGDSFPLSMSMVLVAVAVMVSLATGVLAGFFPAYRAARMNPVDALRND